MTEVVANARLPRLPFGKPRNDRGEDCHGFPSGSLAMTERKIATVSLTGNLVLSLFITPFLPAVF